jgi:hypothetical protein
VCGFSHASKRESAGHYSLFTHILRLCLHTGCFFANSQLVPPRIDTLFCHSTFLNHRQRWQSVEPDLKFIRGSTRDIQCLIRISLSSCKNQGSTESERCEVEICRSRSVWTLNPTDRMSVWRCKDDRLGLRRYDRTGRFAERNSRGLEEAGY